MNNRQKTLEKLLVPACKKIADHISKECINVPLLEEQKIAPEVCGYHYYGSILKIEDPWETTYRCRNRLYDYIEQLVWRETGKMVSVYESDKKMGIMVYLVYT